jgi:hypothetical protein
MVSDWKRSSGRVFLDWTGRRVLSVDAFVPRVNRSQGHGRNGCGGYRRRSCAPRQTANREDAPCSMF